MNQKFYLGIGKPDWVGESGDPELSLCAWEKAGISFVRFFAAHIWHDIFPYKVVGWQDRNHPIFEDEFNPVWFEVMEDICRKMVKHGMRAIVTLIDNCSVRVVEKEKEGRQWWRQLWVIQDFFSEEMKPHFVDFLDKVFPILIKTGLDFDIELVNELQFPAMEEPWKDNRYQWLYWLKALIFDRYKEVPMGRFVFSGGPNWRALSLFFNYYSPHGIVTPDAFNEAIKEDIKEFPLERVILSGDGGSDPDWTGEQPFGRGNMTIEHAQWIAEKMKEYGIYYYEYWNQKIDANKNITNPNLDEAYAMAEILGTLPKPPEPPEPPIPPEPPTPPEPPKPKPCSFYLKRWNIWRWLKCLWKENF
jgi:hypothetical protein